MSEKSAVDSFQTITDPDLWSLSLPWGVRLYKTRKTTSIKAEDSGQISEKLYTNLMEEMHVECRERMKLGDVQDGGWDMCVAGPYRPQGRCLVYSFGIKFDWSFDDAISEEFGCDVRSFDPSMNREEHQHSPRVMFYPLGLGPRNEVIRGKRNQEWQMYTLGTTLKKFGDDNRIIDYLKMDIEYYEWEVFSSIFKENILPRVRQLAFEAHTKVVQKASKTPTTTEEYMSHMAIIRELESLGFRKWYSHQNPAGIYYSERSKKYRTCCYELVYINMNFLKPGYLDVHV